ncbi:TPA: histidine phosphatase family protein [Raoultella terrigena]|jgi:probable phosphoglycerate mutase|uniref:2,3-bisphosphoglycerate-dependent phosphoglycerate mutase n=1 Tax=Raoultella terrigena TaxID=577 RepID=A0A4U9CYK2_RAOTE|nr:histidine phosphatase family protein [Raoultella terrigena]QPF09891.1 histidine phosphatase family protein [Raoultella terrigena]VTM21942.1 2,3-bisphosphoglycerate-dependent phosphoglycerate mutase [Raoultella terrigena]VTN11039.1 2,3-bisphosphoglycerate-dependent phosphoglycerate mutase [Raoultella terrigena]
MKRWLLALIAVTCSVAWSAENKVQDADNDTVNIYFARHGKTLLNTFDRVQGWADSPLTEEGRRVARYLGAGLKGIKFDSFYTSDAGRQRETMAVIMTQAGIAGSRPTELAGLREAFFGGFEGGLNRDMAAAGARQLGLADAAALYREMKAGTLSVRDSQNALASADPRGMTESYDQVKQRVQAALATMLAQAKANGDKNILAISSGTAMQIMISDLTDDPAKNKPLANAAVVKISYHNGRYWVDEIGSLKYVEAGKQALGEK